MLKQTTIRLTKHARERLAERFPELTPTFEHVLRHQCHTPQKSERWLIQKQWLRQHHHPRGFRRQGYVYQIHRLSKARRLFIVSHVTPERWLVVTLWEVAAGVSP